MDEPVQSALARYGLVATDAMRVLGLQSVLGDGVECEMVSLSAPRALKSAGLELVLIDANTTEHLFELLAVFQASRPTLRLIVLGDDADADFVERVIDAGAKGYLSHTSREEDLRLAVRMVREGSVWAPRRILSRLFERSRTQRRMEAQEPVRFTARELEVLRLLLSGRRNQEIATELGVDAATVKAHLARLMRKAGVDNRTALSVRALERRWVERDRG